ncbi:hypothetical protein [Caldibacillus sp. 210928-DFI.2.22]|nr:hypothetical protein [Caldibacillus sp. 210928-DFI.2.22]
MVTRLVLVVKIALFPTQNGDENLARRRKLAFLSSKSRREPGSSSK